MGRATKVAASMAAAAFGAVGMLVAIQPVPARAFPPDQLARGQQVWNEVCSTCHGPDSTNADAPRLLEPNSLRHFPTAAAVFGFASVSMPFDNPGSLTDQQYWDVIAWLLTQQGITDGDTPLGPDTAASIPTRLPPGASPGPSPSPGAGDTGSTPSDAPATAPDDATPAGAPADAAPPAQVPAGQ
ncbi:MAG: cytochrome c [Chloroflexi bacterium]|nr:cytochrome c [Chloroflexota bacterium]